MTRPVVGVIGNAHFVEKRFNLQAVGVRNLRAVAEVAGALPLMFATEPGVTDIGRDAPARAGNPAEHLRL